MAKIKKAQFGTSCRWSKGEKICGTPLKEKLANVRGQMQVNKEERQAKRTPKVGTDKGYERDFPGGISPGGFSGDRGGDKGTRFMTNTKGESVRTDDKKSATKASKYERSKLFGNSKGTPKQKFGGKLSKANVKIKSKKK